MASILPFPSFNDNEGSSWGDNTQPCVLCEAGCVYSDYHLMRHTQTIGRSASFNDALMREPIGDFPPFDYFEDVDPFEVNFDETETIDFDEDNRMTIFDSDTDDEITDMFNDGLVIVG